MQHRSLLLCWLWLFLSLLSESSQGQDLSVGIRQKWLGQFAEGLRQRANTHQKELVQLSQENNWPLRQTFSDGRVMALQGIDEHGLPIYFTTHNNAQAAYTNRTTSLYFGGSIGVNLKGNSSSVINKLGLWDDGKPLTTHQEFGSRIRMNDNNTTITNHATHVAGTLMAAGVNPIAQGMAFGANLKAWDFNNDIFEMSLASSDLLISNHSYGMLAGWVFNPDRPGTDDNLKWEWWGDDLVSIVEDYKFGFYDSRAADFDKIALLSPNYLIVKSADNKRNDYGPPVGTPYYIRNTTQKSTITRLRNDSYGTIPMDANAKNILTVGAIFPISKVNPQPADIKMSSFSSWGPTDDGRIKPDLVSMGVNVTSCSSAANNAYTSQSGTSVAAPSVSGSLLLLQEYYGKLNRNAVMRAATLKGVAIHTADESGDTPGPDYRFGWGLLNIEKAAKFISNSDGVHFMQENSLSQGTTFTQQITAVSSSPLVITLSWTDPEGTPNAINQTALNNRQPKLVNDLDLRLIDGNQTSYPWILDPQNPSLPATVGDNIRDNIEQIVIAKPTPGKKYSLTITHKGTLKYGGQAYSLLVSGAYQTSCQLTAGIAPNSPTTICRGALLRLSANTGTNFRYQWYKDGVAVSGATTYYLYISQAGNYQVRITQGECTALSPATSVSISQVSATIATTGNTNLCNGSSVKLSTASGTSLTYQWLKDGKDISGATSSSYTASLTGNYQVKIQDGSCTVTSAAKSVQAVQLAATTTPSSDFTVCGASSITLSANTGSSFSYQWIKDNVDISGATTSQLSVSQTGSYAVRVTQNGCTASSKAVKITFNSFAAIVVPSGTIRLCGGGYEVLYANTGSNYKYQWLKNGIVISNVTTPYLRVSEAGNYTVKITTPTCIATSAVVVVTTSQGLSASITPLGSTLFYEGGSVTLQANTGSGLSYQWLRNGGQIQGAISSSYIATREGVYTVQVNRDGCSLTSSAITVTVFPSTKVAGRWGETSSESYDSSLTLFPNPADETLSVSFISLASTQSPIAELFTSTGVLVQAQSLPALSATHYQDDVDLRLLPSGTYFVRVSNGQQSFVKAFLKR
ncbi:MAG: S8 family serine peptidase [Spirosomataceae bacterium]